MPMLNAIAVPDGVDEGRIRRQLLDEFNIEVGGGLGIFKGRALRIGLMGFTSSRSNVFLFLTGLEKCLTDQNYLLKPGISIAEAIKKAREIDQEKIESAQNN